MTEAFFLSGLAANACVQAQGVTVSSEDSVFPKANLQNGMPWVPFRFGGIGANPTIDFDNNIIANPSFEVDAEGTSPPTSWKIPTGGGTPDVSTAAAGEPDGTKSLRLNAANEAAYQDRVVRPGGTYRASVALHGDGTHAINAYILDLISGKWWTGSAWSTTKTVWQTRTLASFSTFTADFTLEAPLTGHVGPARVRFLAERPGTITGAAYVDQFLCWPKITVAGLLFDTIPTAFTVAVQSDDNPAFSSPFANGNLPVSRFRRFLTFNGPATLERFWRLAMTGTPFDEYRPFVGQPFLGERRVMSRIPLHPSVADFDLRRIMPLGGTDELPSAIADAYRYGLTATWRNTVAGVAEAMDEMLGACSFGLEPLLIVPRDDKQQFVYGRGKKLSQISERELGDGLIEYAVSYEDDGYPKMTTL